MRTRIPNSVERRWGEGGGGQTASTSFNIRDDKNNVEWLLKQSTRRFNMSHPVEGGRGEGEGGRGGGKGRGNKRCSRDVEALCPGPLLLQGKIYGDARHPS